MNGSNLEGHANFVRPYIGAVKTPQLSPSLICLLSSHNPQSNPKPEEPQNAPAAISTSTYLSIRLSICLLEGL